MFVSSADMYVQFQSFGGYYIPNIIYIKKAEAPE